MASFARMATVTASTKRSSGVSSGLEGAYAEEIASLKCLPLDPVTPELMLGIEGLAFHEVLQTTVEGGLDIVEGDILIVDYYKYPIRSVADWNWKGTDFLTLILEDARASVATDVPASEADALIALYHATGGSAWTDSSGWLTDPVVDNWFGITVDSGHVTTIHLGANNLVGAAGNALAPLAGSLTDLRCFSNSITTLDVSALTLLTLLLCGSNSITILDVTALTSLTFLRPNDNTITTLDISALTSLIDLHAQGNSITTLDLSNFTDDVSYINAEDNGMNQAAVDSMISDIWTRRADWTNATPELHVGGTNATPTGTYEDGYPLPLTTLEEVHDLINDDGITGIQVWASISWAGGSAP